MTIVHFDFTHRINGGNEPLTGTLRFVPTRRFAELNGFVLPKPYSIDYTAPVDVDLLALPTGCAWIVIENIAGMQAKRTIIPNPAVPNYSDLPLIDPTTLLPEATPEAAWWNYANSLGTAYVQAVTDAQTARTGAQTAKTAAEAARDIAIAQTFAGVSLAVGTDLNTILTAGVYTAFSGTIVLNFPADGYSGILLVYKVGTGSLVQEFIAHSGGPHSAKVLWTRRLNGGSWTTWAPFISVVFNETVGQTAGRKAVAYNPAAGADQIIYGDTGWRDITPLMISDASTPAVDVASGSVRLRRFNNTVYIAFVNTVFNNPSVSTSRNYTALIPTGFKPFNTQRQGVGVGPSSSGILTVYSSTGQLALVPGITGAMFNEFSWVTNDAWPSTNPGTQVTAPPAT